MLMNKIFFIILIFYLHQNVTCDDQSYCERNYDGKCTDKKSYNLYSIRYVLYDINPPEGFNLRRDVYLRLAVFFHNLNKSSSKRLSNFKLVLPPWSHLYHWRSTDIASQEQLPWSLFFDIDSLQKFAPVIEMYQFFEEIRIPKTDYITIDESYTLENFQEMFESGNFEDKIKIRNCANNKITFYGYSNITTQSHKCLSFHGPAKMLKLILKDSDARTFMFNNAEIVLHDSYGSKTYWEGRRSMRFNKKLVEIANEFRRKHLNSTNENDQTIRPDDWTQEQPGRNAKGGRYICAHLRRRDFLFSRPREIPNINDTAVQIAQILKRLNLKNVFVATDASLNEINQLIDILTSFDNDYKVFKFVPNTNIKNRFKDGGIAIIDQIICSHAAFFIGTYESTFSFRIQEEREILGFPTETTFNRLCPTVSDSESCERPSMWKIVY